jgi:hypothetical protein
MISIKYLVFRGDRKGLLHIDDAKHIFDLWYDSQIRPLLANAVPVTGDDNDESGWAFFYNKSDPQRRPPKCHTHKAFLIGIEPIKRGVSKAEISLFIDQNRFADDIQTLLERIRDEGLSGD